VVEDLWDSVAGIFDLVGSAVTLVKDLVVATLEQALPPLLARLARLGGAATSVLGRQLGVIARTLADPLERLLGAPARRHDGHDSR